jgi:hypothetical protein
VAFDARSRERLEQLGRQLPQPLPQPDAGSTRAGSSKGQGGRSHRLETETDPQALFRELMQASPDGTVPPHLLQRLRDVEQQKPPLNGQGPFATTASASAPASSKTAPKRVSSPSTRDRARPNRDQDPLYVSFEQMLLEDENL